MNNINEQIVLWLTESNSYGVKYRTYKDLLALNKTDIQLIKSKQELIESAEAEQLIDIIQDPEKRTAHINTFGKFAGFVILNQLAEFGLTREDLNLDPYYLMLKRVLLFMV